MRLRPYQSHALETLLSASVEEQFLLLHAATAAGKTVVFSALIKRLMEDYQMRIALCAHREILVRQAYDKLMRVWPAGSGLVGLACSSVSKSMCLDAPVVIGSPQTLAVRDIGPRDLLIVDECHYLPHKEEESQYGGLIRRLAEATPDLRTLGVTATPFRLGHGYIYGDRLKPGRTNWFPKLHYSISIDTLTRQGFLAPLRCKEAVEVDLSGVRHTAGEFNLRELSRFMSREIHVASAVEAYERHGEERRHVAIFCVGIEHAVKVADAFSRRGHRCGVVHSKMPGDERKAVLNAFDSGDLTHIVNVDTLTEGWDSTAVDCLIVCRPTESPARYVQILGRGARIHEGKNDCLVLDLSGNCRKHGNPSAPRVVVPGDNKSSEAVVKICMACQAAMFASVRVCKECGAAFPPPQKPVEAAAAPELAEVTWGASDAAVESFKAQPFRSKAGNVMTKLSIICKRAQGLPFPVNVFLDFEGQSGDYPRQKARRFWGKYGKGPGPMDTAAAVAAINSGLLSLPSKVSVQKNGKYHNIVGL